MEAIDPRSDVLQRNDSFIVKDVKTVDSDSEDLSESGATRSSDTFDDENQLDDDTFASSNLATCNIDGVNYKSRKNKPPNLKLIVHPVPNISQDEPEEPSQLNTDVDTSDVLSAIKPQARRSSDAGRSSPIVKRSSMLEKILEIPDVKAALVIDEGYEMLRRRSFDKTCIDRQPTPACSIEKKHFNFEQSSSKDGDSESVSESDTSSIQSTPDVLQDGEKPCVRRPHADVLKDSLRKSNPLDRIADSTGPATVFGTPIKKQSPGDTSPSLKKKWRKKANSVEDDDETAKPSTPRSRLLLKRLKFSSLSRSGSSSSFEGWDSLARALARVGAVPPSISIDEDLHPKLSPILKKRPQVDRWSSESSSSSQEPGTKPPARKKTVSFSRLPSESIIKNAADCVYRMHEGHHFVKMRSNSRVYNRLYWFDQTDNCLRWEPSKKDSGKARIEISQIREIRPGKVTEMFLSSEISNHFPDECSFSIIHREGKTLDLIANSADEANVWITGLRCLMSGQDMEELKMRSDARDLWLSSMFDVADINGDGFLDEEESLKLLTSLSDGVRELRIKQRLQEYLQLKENNKARLTKVEFIKIFKDVATRPDVYFLLARYATADDRLSIDDLLTFLESEQGVEHVTKDGCLEIINTFEPSERVKSIPALGIDGFTKYLNSDRCAIFNPAHRQVCQDMNQPLTDYFIASSHNTYLMEDQVSGPSNINAYVRALLRCCRCVELDCWDGPDGEPIVTHGHSKTNSIPFRQVLQVINETAFRNSPYPVIISLENHCSEKQQLLIAKDLREALGERIYTKPLPSKQTQLPSPESLKNQFLIRARKLPPDCAEDIGYVSEEDEGKEVGLQLVTTPPSPDDSSSSTPDLSDKKVVLVRELSDLVSICISVSHSDDLANHQRSFSCDHTSSIHEKTALKLFERKPDEFASYTQKFLTRVYPSPLRFDSSNFNPQDFWNCGVQIASLNYQTPGLMMDINDGKFSMNGGCGYVLKPDVMRNPLSYYSLMGCESLPSVPPKNLHIRVISGQNFPKPRGGGAKGHVIDPYVLIELFGVPIDCAEQRTRTATNNSGGFAVFDEPFEFRLVLPSISLVRFVVLDDDYINDEFIGQYTIPFDCLQPGYRHMHLRSIFDEPLENAALFVHIAITDADFYPSTPGSMTPVPNVNKNPGGKRPNLYKRPKKFRSRKESDATLLCDINRPELDEAFGEAHEALHLAAYLRDSLRWSLAAFREACGLSSLSSIKQCVRVLAHRNRCDNPFCDVVSSRSKRKNSTPAETEESDDKVEARRRAASSDAGPVRLGRQHSDASQSSSSDSGLGGNVKLTKVGRKISVNLRGLSSSSDIWRKVSSCIDSMVEECLSVLDKATGCCDALTAVLDKVVKLRAGLPTFLNNGPETSESGDSYAPSNGPLNKKSSKVKKKQSLSIDIDRKKRRTLDDNFRWNCSVLQGHRETIQLSLAEAEKVLNDLWEAGLQYSLADPSTEVAGDLSNGTNKSTNANSNNNQGTPSSNDKPRYGEKLKSVPFVRSMSHLTKPKVKPERKLTKRSISSDSLPV